jgi:hypothetical protein
MIKTINDDGNYDLREFYHACRVGELSQIQKVCKSTKKRAYVDLNRGIKEAIEGGQLEVVKYILTTNDFSQEQELEFNDYGIFWKIGEAGYVDVMQYILTSDDVAKYVDQDSVQNMFFGACMAKTATPVKFMLDQHNLRHLPDVNAQNDMAIYYAINYGCMDTVKYLLTSNKIKKHANLEPQADMIVQLLAGSVERRKVLEYLVMECGLRRNVEITTFLENKDNAMVAEPIWEIFKAGESKFPAKTQVSIKIKN